MLGIFLVPVSLNIHKTQNNNPLSIKIISTTNIAEAFPAPNWPNPFEAIFGGLAEVAGSVIKAVLNLIFVALSQIAYFSAKILDFFVFYSIGSDAYRSTFVEAAWGTVRDVANIFFLLGLLYVAIQIVLDIGVSEKKKMIGNIIVMALLVNFSLFATQVVIDASNIVARIFYSQIESKDETGKNIPEDKKNKVPKSLTLGIVDAFKPQTILDERTDTKYEILTLLLLIGVLGYLCYMFLSVALLFVGRVVSLWVAMIFSPIAFMTRAIGIKIPDISWHDWLENLTKSAMMAPLFIFFMYIILLLSKWLTTLQNSIKLSDSGGDQTVLNLMNVLIPFAIIFTLLMKAKSLAVKYSGDIGKQMSSITSTVAGVAGGVALGGLAVAGTRSLGALSNKILGKKGEDLKEKANQKGFGGLLARTQLRALNYGQKATFDFRQTKLGNKMVKATGWDMQGSKIVGLESKAGGFKGVVENKAKEHEKEFELYKSDMSKKDLATWNEKRRASGLSEYNSVDELNHARQKAFIDNIAYTGFVGNLAYGVASVTGGIVDNKNYTTDGGYRNRAREDARTKEGSAFDENAFNEKFKKGEIAYNKEWAKEINAERMKNTKIGLGAAASLLTGGAIGGIAGLGFGLGASGTTGVILRGEDVAEGKGIDKFKKEYEKSHEKVEKVQARIKEVEKTINEQQDSLNKALNITLEDGTTKDISREVDAKGNVLSIHKKELDEAINGFTIAKQIQESMINAASVAIVNSGGVNPEAQRQRDDAMAKLKTINTSINELNSIKGAEEKKQNAERTKLDLEGKKDALHGSHKSGAKVNVDKPSAKHDDHKDDSHGKDSSHDTHH